MDQDRRRRHRAWLEGFGFTPADWARIKAHALATTRDRRFAALDDLLVPVRVGACLPEEASRLNGRLLGAWRGRALLYWPMAERERNEWAKRRGTAGAGRRRDANRTPDA